MSGQEDAPLPRYRFYHKPQRWMKEPLRFVVPTDEEEKSEGRPPFESSFDYFLRRSYAVQTSEDPQARLSQKRMETNREIERFQARNMIAGGASSIAVTERESSDDDSEMDVDSDVEEREGHNAAPAVELANPLMGYVSGFPLYKIYASMVDIKKDILEEGDEGQIVSMRMSFDEFQQLIKRIGNGNLLSTGYLQKIFRALPSYTSSSESVQVYTLFSYIVENTYHPSLNRNVSMLFHAFGMESGLIPLASLHSRVVFAWAEINTFGNLRGQWVKLARALETVEKEIFEEKLIARNSLYLNPQEVRALMCSHPLLWKVTNSIDMDGGGKKSKKEETT